MVKGEIKYVNKLNMKDRFKLFFKKLIKPMCWFKIFFRKSTKPFEIDFRKLA